MEYDVMIGLEVHAELSTKTKMYCGCRNTFGKRVNSNCCEICSAMPGTLPTLNKKAINYAVKTGLAFNCKINNYTKQDRKNYFYPDLPKAYQISQNDIPLCVDGYINILLDEGKIVKKVNIKQIHIEEDTGKLIHDPNESGVLIDFNRCGIPLIEIVSMPNLNSAYETKTYLDTIKSVLQSIDVSDCKMQESSLRCDINISLKPKTCDKLGTRCEIKNVSTFNGAVNAVKCEISRQKNILNSGSKVEQLTMRWDDSLNDNVVMRAKENAVDYRYFKEPDLPTIYIAEEEVNNIKKSIGELPNDAIIRFINKYQISFSDAWSLIADKQKSEFFENCINNYGANAKKIANWLLGDISRILNEKDINLSDTKLTCENLTKMVKLIDSGDISNTTGKTILETIIEKDIDPVLIVEEKELKQVNDKEFIVNLAKKVLKDNPQVKELYKSGKTNILGFAVGQCMKNSNEQGNPVLIKDILLKLIEG